MERPYLFLGNTRSMERRTFLQSGTMAAVASAIPCSPLGLPFSLSAREPIVRSGAARLRLALAAYSFRRNFAYMKGKDQKPAAGNEPMDMYKFVDFCGEHGCLGAELTSYFFPTNAKRKYFLDLKRHAFERGVEICGTAIGNNFSIGAGEELDKQIEAANVWINNAAILGAPHIRFFRRHSRPLLLVLNAISQMPSTPCKFVPTTRRSEASC